MEMQRLIRLPEVVKMTSLPKSSIYLKIKNDEFPRPVKTGVRSRAWQLKSVVEWMNSRPLAMGEDVNCWR